jgi:hypothetical protein
MEDRLGRCKHALRDPEQLPSVVLKVAELLRTVNGDQISHQQKEQSVGGYDESLQLVIGH